VLGRLARKFGKKGFPRLLAVLEAASYVAGVIALCLLYIQLQNDAAARRAQHTLEFVSQFNSDPMSSHRQNALKPWLDHAGQLGAINAAGGLPRAEIDSLSRQVVAEYDAGHVETPASLSIQEVAGFFDQLAICIDSSVCDAAVARDYFEDYATNFWCMNRAVLADLRREFAMPELGEGLRPFQRKRGC